LAFVYTFNETRRRKQLEGLLLISLLLLDCPLAQPINNILLTWPIGSR